MFNLEKVHEEVVKWLLIYLQIIHNMAYCLNQNAEAMNDKSLLEYVDGDHGKKLKKNKIND